MKLNFFNNNLLLSRKFSKLSFRRFTNKSDEEITKLPLDKNIDPREIMKSINLNRFTEEITNQEKGELVEINKEIIESTNDLSTMSRSEQIFEIKKRLDLKEKIQDKKRNYKMRVAMSFAILLIGGFSLWVPLYKRICETMGYSVKTHQKNYNFAPEKMKDYKKFVVNFIDEVDVELPWEFTALQDHVRVNAGETCLIFYRVRNKTDRPIVGLSVYDVHPQTLSIYFNKIQCFCFENQLLGPYEEVDLPVFFYIDPSVNDDENINEFREINLKYTFYLAKRQELAKIVEKQMKKHEEDKESLKNRKIELNKQGKNYSITEDDDVFTPLPGLNNFTAQNYVNSTNK